MPEYELVSTAKNRLISWRYNYGIIIPSGNAADSLAYRLIGLFYPEPFRTPEGMSFLKRST